MHPDALRNRPTLAVYALAAVAIVILSGLIDWVRGDDIAGAVHHALTFGVVMGILVPIVIALDARRQARRGQR